VKENRISKAGEVRRRAPDEQVIVKTFVAHARVPPELPVAFIFFASGAAALIFEVVWFHRAGLVFGNDLWSTSIVLSTFMGGLALGNALVVASGHRIRRFLRTYATLEAIVAITGVAVTHLLPQVTRPLVPILRHLPSHPWLINGTRSVFAFAVLTVPTTAMGATLPILVAALYPQERGFGRVLGRLYGWNTLGAVVGVLSAELVLIPALGVAGSAWFAGLVNVTGAIAALVISRRVGESRAIPSDNTLLESPRAAHRTRRLLACAFMAGAGLMALEVIWFRFLSMFVLNSTLTVSLMLAVVLAAIGMGGLTAATWLQCRPHATNYLPAAAFSTATAVSGSYVMFQFLVTSPSAAQWYRILWFACTLTFAASVLSGVIFTFIGAALRSDHPLDTRAAGWLTLANTMGAMCGSLAATFVLLPTLGMERAIFALAILYSAIGVLAMLSPPKWRSAADRATSLAALATLAVLIRFPFGLMADKYFGRVAATYGSDGSRIVATREGPSETIFLMEQRWLGRPIYDRLVTNGFSMSGTHLANKRYMRFFVYWPMLVHSGPLRRVLVVCHGVGVTLKAVTDLDSVDSIDVAEISPDVIAMNDIIYPPSEQPLRDRRVQLHIEDGRQFLQLTDQRFD
jgi:spermidine synthase